MADNNDKNKKKATTMSSMTFKLYINIDHCLCISSTGVNISSPIKSHPIHAPQPHPIATPVCCRQTDWSWSLSTWPAASTYPRTSAGSAGLYDYAIQTTNKNSDICLHNVKFKVRVHRLIEQKLTIAVVMENVIKFSAFFL